MTNPSYFIDKKILITGAAVGIGKATATLLSQLGAKVILIDVNEALLSELLEGLYNKNNLQITFDMGDVDGIEPLVKSLISKIGPIDGFVHCVGIRSRRPLSLITPKVLSEVMNINFGSFIEMVRCITKKNYFNENLSIVGVSSIASVRGGTSVTAYAASKAAMDGAVRCLAKELAPKKIRVNTVVPAQINTPAYAELMRMNNNAEDQTLARQYLGLGEAVDVANVIAFLLGENSRFISGSAIPVDGGFLSS